MKTTVSLVLALLAVAGARAEVVVRPEPIQPIEAAKPADPRKVELGKKLFFETRLSKSGFLSCNSCHNLSAGGTDNLPSSIGHKWNLGPINAPTVLNARFNLAQFWDGRAKDLTDQAGGPIANPGEMGSNHELAVEVLTTIPQYVTWFEEIYGKNPVSIEQVKDSIAAFEETLVTPDSRFDRWLKGDDAAITEAERKGYQVFKETGCIACHNGPAVGGNSFQKFGLVKAYEKDTTTVGRMGVTKNEADRFVFKVPTLRNIELTYPYFHDGSVWTLEEAVTVMSVHQFGKPIKPEDTALIVAFLKTLTGKQPDFPIPTLPPSTATTPRPSAL